MEGTNPTTGRPSEPMIVNGDDSEDDHSEDHGHYPTSYRVALSNRLDIFQIGELIMQSPLPLFVYGSLQIPSLVVAQFSSSDTLSELALAQRMIPGKLIRFKMFSQRIGDFPAILDTGNPADVVTGMMILGLSEGQRQRLDRYEGGWYSREVVNVKVHLSTGEYVNIMAHTYIWAQGRNELASPNTRIWSIDQFISSMAFDDFLPPDDTQATIRIPTPLPPGEPSTQAPTPAPAPVPAPAEANSDDPVVSFDAAGEGEFASSSLRSNNRS